MLDIVGKFEYVNNVVDTILTNTSELRLEHCHCTEVFPEDTDDYIRVTTGATNNSYSAWEAMVSNKNITFSSNCNESCCHITGVLIEDTQTASIRYTLELSQGANHSVVVQQRIYTDAANKPTVQQARMATCCINASEDVWMRAKSSTGGKWMDFALRFHHH